MVRVLLVEDSTLLLRSLATTLQEFVNVQVVATARSEEVALKLMRASPDAFDLIVIDIFLSSGSGLGVIRAARTLNMPARIVVLSNYATLDVRKRCVGLGADRVFDKSRQIEDFVAYCGSLAAATASADADNDTDDGPATEPGG